VHNEFCFEEPIEMVCSIASTNILLFLSKTSKIGENTFDFLCLTLALLSTNGVVGLFISVVIDGESKITVFG
jgi:hypothetical protein